MQPIITKKEADRILKVEGETIVSLDLGISQSKIIIKDGFALIGENKIPIEDFKKAKEGCCYAVEDNQLKKIAFFSEETNFYYKLLPTKDWPTFTLSSTPMHRHANLSPKEDTMLKIKEISPVIGNVLDTCCGSGYTAITAAKNAEHVFTFEKDSNVLFLAKFNPYSRELFSNKKIDIFEEDIFEGIKKFKSCFFDRIVHDPPTFKYAPELYSREFYSGLYRVLKKGGIIYHYTPWPHKTRKEVFYKGVVRKLKEIGFESIAYMERSCGVVARK